MNRLEQSRDAEARLTDVLNLIDALEIVSWELTSQAIEHGSEIDRLRNAVVGLSSALKNAATAPAPAGLNA